MRQGFALESPLTVGANAIQIPTSLCSSLFMALPGPKPISPLKRYIRDPETDCWLWQGGKESYGYAVMCFQGQRNIRVHRFVYEKLVGPIPSGALLCHTCDVRHCINPKHLFIGSGADNMRDMASKGRSAHGERNGVHKLTEDEVLKIYSSPLTSKQLSDQFGVYWTVVQKIKNGQIWRRVTERSGQTPHRRKRGRQPQTENPTF